jgi:hypothetical protein
MRKTLTALLFLLATGVAWAIPRPEELSSHVTASKPYGEGSLSWLFITAYDASLWTDAQRWSMNEPFALTLVYRMSFTTDEMVERTLEEMKALYPALTADQLQRHARMLRNAFPPVKAGDRITAMHTPGQPVRFFHNGRMTTSSEDSTFADPFFGIWLSPKTSEPSLRRALLRLPG